VTDPRTPGSSGPASPLPDLHANGVQPANGGFGSYANGAVTSVDDLDATGDGADDGYDWHAPQALAPRYGDEGDAPAADYTKSAEAWWDEVRGANGAVAAPGQAQQVGAGSAEQAAVGGYGNLGDHNDHTASISAVPSVGPTVEPGHDSGAQFVPAYNGYPGDEQQWGASTTSYGAPPPAATTDYQNVPDPRAAARPATGPRRARLSLRRIDPWSTLKFSLVLAVALFVVWMVAVGVLYGVLSGMGVFDKINSTVNDVNGSTGKTVTPQIVLGVAGVVGGVSIVLFTALATVGSFIYNLCADMVGGLEVTLAERD